MGVCSLVVVAAALLVTGVARVWVTALVPCLFMGMVYLLVCELSVCGDDVQGQGLFVGCLAAEVHGWFVVAFTCAMSCIVLGVARPL